MFNRLGTVVTQHWKLVILAWIVLAVGLKFVAPRWDDVTHDGDLAHLPAEMASVRGAALLHAAFPDTRAKSQIALVVARDGGPLLPADYALAGRLAEYFQAQQAAGALPILAVWTRSTEVVGRMLTSADQQATLVVLQLSNEFMAADNIRVLTAVQEALPALIADAPGGLRIGVTGAAAIGGDMLRSAAESIKNTEVATVVLVVLILLLVYRAPLLVLVPLVAIAVSLSVSIDLIALLTQVNQLSGFESWQYKIFKTTRIFVVVILYGAGTDYCLFLIARYREELAAGRATAEAVNRALQGVGDALVASALTTILGLSMMYFADFGKFSYSGPTIALALTVTLAACLTLVPALLIAFGRVIFWPRRAVPATPWPAALPATPSATPRIDSPGWFDGFWEWSSHKILAYPGRILLLAFLLTAPLAYAGLSVEITYDLLGELRHDRVSVQGTQLLRRHFAAGETGPLTVLAYHPEGGFDTKEGEHEIARLTKFLYELPGVTSVRSLAEPTGEPPGKVQLFSTESLLKLTAKQHPITKAQFVTPNPELKGRVARLEVITQYDPFAQEAIEQLNAVETQLAQLRRKSPIWRDVTFEFSGTTAGIRDLKRVTESDQRLIQRLVVISVLFAILVILRHPVVCLYLIASVLWSYFVTIGATELFFAQQYGATYHGLDWKVPIFLFVILIAVGEDYNIYLVTRVFEEQRRHGLLEGLRIAVVRTGGIITSCGVIMAGTFVSMMTGTLRGMSELGFALSLGVLLDTFLVRPILVPAFLALVAKFQLRRAARTTAPDQASP